MGSKKVMRFGRRASLMGMLSGLALTLLGSYLLVTVYFEYGPIVTVLPVAMFIIMGLAIFVTFARLYSSGGGIEEDATSPRGKGPQDVKAVSRVGMGAGAVMVMVGIFFMLTDPGILSVLYLAMSAFVFLFYLMVFMRLEGNGMDGAPHR